MNENFEIKIIEDVATLKTKVEDIEKQVDDMSDIKTAITRLTVVQEQQIEQDKKMQDLFEKQSAFNERQFQTNVEVTNTLKTMNESLKLLSDEIKKVDNKVDGVNDKVDSVKNDVAQNNKKIDDFEDKFKTSSEEKNYFKIDKRKVGEFVKNNYKKILVGLSALGLSGTGIYKLIESLMS